MRRQTERTGEKRLHRVTVVTDSTGYLPEHVLAQYLGVLEIVPLKVHFPGVTLTDGLAVQTQFLELLRASHEIPTTSQPSPEAFRAVFTSCLAEGEVVVLTISRRLSGTYESALAAARSLDPERITVLDSRTTGGALALLVEAAAAAAKAGRSRAEIVTELEDLISRLRLLFVPATLEYLRRGGRIGRAAALLGSVLQIRPVLCLHQGEVEVLDKVRTRKAALKRLVEELDPACAGPVALIHIAAPEQVPELEQLVRERAPAAQTKVYETGPVIAAHTGPGTLGLAFFT